MVYGACYKQSLCLYRLQLFLGGLQNPKKTSEVKFVRKPKFRFSAEISNFGRNFGMASEKRSQEWVRECKWARLLYD